jgi:hypothetical protein
MDEKRHLPATARITSVNKFTVDDAFVGGTNLTVELSGHAAHQLKRPQHPEKLPTKAAGCFAN